MEIDQPDFGKKFCICECCLDHYFREKEEDLYFARDIAEFEKNKHLAKPSNTLDGMRVKWLYYRDFKTRLTLGPGCWLEGGHGSWTVKKANQTWQSFNRGSENVSP